MSLVISIFGTAEETVEATADAPELTLDAAVDTVEQAGNAAMTPIDAARPIVLLLNRISSPPFRRLAPKKRALSDNNCSTQLSLVQKYLHFLTEIA